MKLKVVVISVIVIAVVAVGYLLFNPWSAAPDIQYQLASITRGNLESTSSASGILSPITTVDVGTQVSGTIDSVFIDYNDQVRKGQLLAVLDTVLLKTSVQDAEAGLERAKAQLEQASYDFQINDNLFKQGLISENTLMPFKINVKLQTASLKSAEAAYQRALRNLQYAVIRSPISGTVIAKNIEAGQTVAASFSTPTLFKIAEDLSLMEILVDVSEGDIGQVKVNQMVRFEVQAYPDIEFEGIVRQVRMQPNTISNVVNYTAVVEAANKDNLLLPGMTATVDFIIEQKNDVLLVPSRALRFKPSDDQLSVFRNRKQEERPRLFNAAGSTDSSNIAQEHSKRSNIPSAAKPNRKLPKDLGQIWYLDSTGQLAMEPVRIGMTDGTNTEIVMSQNLKEGIQVIIGLNGGLSKSPVSNFDRGPGPGFRIGF